MKENAIKAALAAALGGLCAYGVQLLVPVLVLVPALPICAAAVSRRWLIRW